MFQFPLLVGSESGQIWSGKFEQGIREKSRKLVKFEEGKCERKEEKVKINIPELLRAAAKLG